MRDRRATMRHHLPSMCHAPATNAETATMPEGSPKHPALTREGLILAIFEHVREIDSQAVSSRDEAISLLAEIVRAVDSGANP